MSEPWKGIYSFVSPHNFDPEVRAGWNLPSKVRIHDNTLRDGEQQPGMVFRKDEKIQTALLLDEMGIPEIEVGMPVVSKEDSDAMKELSGMGLKARLMCLVRTLKADIDVAADVGVSGVVVEIPSSHFIHDALGWDSDGTVSRAFESISYAKERGLYASLFPWDSTRADLNYWLKIAKAGVDAGADAVAFVDTLGVTSPLSQNNLQKSQWYALSGGDLLTFNDYLKPSCRANSRIISEGVNAFCRKCSIHPYKTLV